MPDCRSFFRLQAAVVSLQDTEKPVTMRAKASLDYSPRPANDRLPPSGPTPANQRVAAHRMPYQFVNNPG